MTLCRLQSGLAGWLHKIPANLLFSVSTLVLKGVSQTSSHLENPNFDPPACPLEGLTDFNGYDWNGHLVTLTPLA